jgi:NAD(P)-dependent dehydrogenase (short-subunit alcohol dehydrogenase family)
MLSKFVNKTIVITGAASGLGRELARKSAQQGMRLALVDFNADALADTTKALGKEFPDLSPPLAVVANVADQKQMDTLGESVRAHFGSAPHYVVNNAGVAHGGLVWENTMEEWDWLLGVNLMGVIHGIRVFTPMMLAAARSDAAFRGRIINTSSMAGMVSIPLSGMYNVSKHAVVTLTETLYQDLSLVTDQVSASVLCPFFVPTGIATSQRPDSVLQQGKTASKIIAEQSSVRAVSSGKITAEQVADIVFDAIEKEQFYIFTHPKVLVSVKERLQDIMEQRNPTDPYVGKPEIGIMLKKALKDAMK